MFPLTPSIISEFLKGKVKPDLDFLILALHTKQDVFQN